MNSRFNNFIKGIGSSLSFNPLKPEDLPLVNVSSKITGIDRYFEEVYSVLNEKAYNESKKNQSKPLQSLAQRIKNW